MKYWGICLWFVNCITITVAQRDLCTIHYRYPIGLCQLCIYSVSRQLGACTDSAASTPRKKNIGIADEIITPRTRIRTERSQVLDSYYTI